ncbi:hypothetical protein QR680_015048 [Steinernema hermaphroditum]|uniref:Uncharacterized protein n=1 Tax=Steinernema hermaphroditum TaxID=289476 RepID=A0AA39IDI4_9BILA|nr:hypothetical protein QR680_015048 [Steinernema hermaphroditum]
MYSTDREDFLRNELGSDRFESRPSSRKTVTFDLEPRPSPKLDQVVIGLHIDQHSPIPKSKVKETATQFQEKDIPKADALKEEKKFKKGSKTVALGIELCREQNGHVTACKFPLRRSFDSVRFSVSPPPASVLKKSEEMVYTQLAAPLKTVDIPLGGPLPDNNGIMTINLEIDHGPSGRHDFGFTVTGGKDRHEPVIIEKVMVSSAADRAGLQVGDHILDINGESVIEKYHKTVKRMISEATWVGAIEIRIRRPSYLTTNGHAKANGTIPTGQGQVDYSTTSFNEKRTMFDQAERGVNSYAQFVQKKKMQTPSKWGADTRRAYTREGPTDGLPDRTYSPSMSSISPQSSNEYRTSTLESNKSLGSTTKSYHDYRVTAIHDKPDPGKLTDFIPEVERGVVNKVSYLDGPIGNPNADQPKLIRNYNYNIVKSNFDVPPPQPTANNNNNNAPKIHKWVNSSSLPRESRNTPASDHSGTDDDTQPGRAFLRKHLRQVTPLDHGHDDYANIDDYRRQASPSSMLEAPIYAVPPQLTRRSRSTEPFAQHKPEKEIPIQRGTVTYETRKMPYERHVPIRLTGHPSSFKFKRQPVEERYTEVDDGISDVSYRFYDHDGQEMGRVRSVEDLLARREREVITSPAPTLTEVMDAKEWRHIVREQRLPNPGNPYSKTTFENNPKYDVIQKSVDSMKDLRPVNGTLPKMTERVIAETVNKSHSTHVQEEVEPPITTETTTSSGEKLFAVSGRHKCAHCDMELGRGAAMIIESLKLFYHLSCFRCYVCNMALGNGTQGADVRVRGAKLHCQRCYSSDDNGKYSRI